ncbi:MAG: hypothetical protein ACYCZH_04825 [Sulfuriferula sp.]
MGKRSYRKPDFGRVELWLAVLMLCIGTVAEIGAREAIRLLSDRNTSTSAQIGRQLAEIIRRRPFALPPQAPRYFSVPVNRKVARAPAFIIPSDAQLLSALHMEAPL